MFYFYRIWVLLKKKNWIIPGLLACASIAQFVMAIVYSVKVTTLSSDQLPTLTNLISGVNGVSAGLDVMIAGIMCYIFTAYRTGFKKTDTILMKLVAYVVSSGFLTSICALGTFISFILSPTTFIAYPFNFIISRMYIVSFLASLNSRQYLRSSGRDHTEEFNLSSDRGAHQSHGNGAPRVLISIERHEDTYRNHRDIESKSIEDSTLDRK
ncbi:hypothetical protein K435DRAFT_773339 [Dendrothele bispora CBS 962.96]|uniref:DUF6534 domain-containing protein n=1 Tax=Dendrothele bispora (strain CBS 962.96) TaxID=1314807 RepID=A0A4S8MVE8_DENBC|nr:hypothetical protein K435DRAFT_773339 [Dendrothele bispora CBS 962.96]